MAIIYLKNVSPTVDTNIKVVLVDNKADKFIMFLWIVICNVKLTASHQ